VSTRIPKQPRQVRGGPQLEGLLRQLPGGPRLGERDFGEAVVEHRTSWVRRAAIDSGQVFVKTYDYSSSMSVLRGWLRHTGPFVRSRAAAEFDALEWMRRNDLPAPQALGVLEHRWLGHLRRAILVTAAFPGAAVDALMPELASPARLELAAAIGALVARLHRLGFRDRNLDLRNLIAHREPSGGWRVAKLDSPRHRLLPAGRADDALARADWQRLLPQLLRFGIAAEALAEFTHPSADSDRRA
jgi:hypothetical protein